MAYDLDIAGLFKQRYDIIPTSLSVITGGVASEYTSAQLARSGDWQGVLRIPQLLLGNISIISFAVAIKTSVYASDYISTTVELDYSSSPTPRGHNVYLYRKYYCLLYTRDF